MQKRSNTHNTKEFFAETFGDFRVICELLEKTKKGQAQAGNETLAMFIKELKALKEHVESNKPLSTETIKHFKDSISIMSKIWCEHATAGWYIEEPHEKAVHIFQDYKVGHDEIIVLLNQIRAISKENEKLFSDMIVHFRLFKALVNFLLISGKISLLNSNEKLPEILDILKNLEMECNYLMSKLPRMNKANQVFNGYSGMLYQCHFGMLTHKLKVVMQDQSGKIIEYINPKNLLKSIQNIAAEDERSLVQSLPLCVTMAARLLNKEMTQQIISQSLGTKDLDYKLSKGDFNYTWQFLKFFVFNIEDAIKKRGAYSKDISKILNSHKPSAKKYINTLLSALVGKLKQCNELSEDFLYFQIIEEMNTLKEYKPENLNDALFTQLECVIKERKAARMRELEYFIQGYSEVRLVNDSSPYLVLPLFKGLKNKLIQGMKVQGCKLKLIFESVEVKSENICLESLRDIQLFLEIHSKIKKEFEEKKFEIEVVTEQFEKIDISKTVVISGHRYRAENPLPEEKKKTKGSENSNIPLQLVPVDDVKQNSQVSKFASLFGEAHKEKNIKRCNMLSGVTSYYVCLEDNTDWGDCTEEERIKFKMLFAEPKQARNKNDTGFKISDVQKNGEFSLCAKLKGKGGNKRAYAYEIVHSKKEVLFLFRKIVNKNSQAEKKHVVERDKVAESFLPKPASSSIKKKLKEKRKKK